MQVCKVVEKSLTCGPQRRGIMALGNTWYVLSHIILFAVCTPLSLGRRVAGTYGFGGPFALRYRSNQGLEGMLTRTPLQWALPDPKHNTSQFLKILYVYIIFYYAAVVTIKLCM